MFSSLSSCKYGGKPSINFLMFAVQSFSAYMIETLLIWNLYWLLLFCLENHCSSIVRWIKVDTASLLYFSNVMIRLFLLSFVFLCKTCSLFHLNQVPLHSQVASGIYFVFCNLWLYAPRRLLCSWTLNVCSIWVVICRTSVIVILHEPNLLGGFCSDLVLSN